MPVDTDSRGEALVFMALMDNVAIASTEPLDTLELLAAPCDTEEAQRLRNDSSFTLQVGNFVFSGEYAEELMRRIADATSRVLQSDMDARVAFDVIVFLDLAAAYIKDHIERDHTDISDIVLT